MSLLHKIKNIFSTKVSATAIVDAPQGSGKMMNTERYDLYTQETYMLNIIAFRCIKEVARSIGSIPWGLYQETGDDTTEVEDHELLNMLRRANIYESFSKFMEKAVSYYMLSGNVPIERVQLTAGAYPAELYALRPDRLSININSSSGLISSYVYTNGSKKVVYDLDPITQQGDCLLIKDFHPLDDWFGMSPIKAAAYDIDTLNEVNKWNKSLLENQGRPGMLFLFKTSLTSEQYDRFEAALAQRHGGGANAGKNLIVENAEEVDVKPYGFSPQELDWIEGSREKARRVCLAFGVPPMLIGIPGDNTYSNYKEARLAFWEDTVLPIATMFQNEFNSWIFFGDESGLYFDLELDGIPALAPKREALWTSAQQADFLTINEKRNLVGFESIDGGDVILTPATMIPLEDAGELGDAPNDEDTE